VRLFHVITLAALADRRIKASPADLAAALRGRVTGHHRFMLRLHLGHLDALDAAIARIEQEVDANLEPFRQAVRILSTIPGISALSAQVVVAEIGIDMHHFPSAGHLLSWAGLCPKNDESAGPGHRRIQPLRQRPRLQTDARQQHLQRAKPGDQRLGLARQFRLAHDPPRRLDHTDAGAFQ